MSPTGKKMRCIPGKKNRPIAAGKISPLTAILSAFLFFIAGLGPAFFTTLEFGLIIVLYLVINLAYSFKLKHVVLFDVFGIAAGFMLRIIGGTVAIQEPASS